MFLKLGSILDHVADLGQAKGIDSPEIMIVSVAAMEKGDRILRSLKNQDTGESVCLIARKVQGV